VQAEGLTVQGHRETVALLDQSEELALSQQEGREELFERVKVGHNSGFAVLRLLAVTQHRDPISLRSKPVGLTTQRAVESGSSARKIFVECLPVRVYT